MSKVEMKIQRREMEVRAVMEPENDSRIVEGYAVRFNESTSFMVGGTKYSEVIDRSALDKTDMSDVPFKYNHSDSFMIMARTRNKTLQLIRDENGLKIRAQLADTSDGRDLYELIKRGDVDKMSFAFTVRKDEYDKKAHTRTIQDIDKLYDVSAVDFPAYDTTSISARSFFELESENERKELDRTEARQRQQQKLRTLLKLGRK
jgi:HK97 family phage prohead protease